jgi:hypothetical protein
VAAGLGPQHRPLSSPGCGLLTLEGSLAKAESKPLRYHIVNAGADSPAAAGADASESLPSGPGNL